MLVFVVDAATEGQLAGASFDVASEWAGDYSNPGAYFLDEQVQSGDLIGCSVPGYYDTYGEVYGDGTVFWMEALPLKPSDTGGNGGWFSDSGSSSGNSGSDDSGGWFSEAGSGGSSGGDDMGGW